MGIFDEGHQQSIIDAARVPEANAPMARPDVQSCAGEPLTANPDSLERCANRPFCKSAVISRPGKKYCSDRCRMDGYVLTRARAMLDEVGIVEFNAILQCRAPELDHTHKWLLAT